MKYLMLMLTFAAAIETAGRAAPPTVDMTPHQRLASELIRTAVGRTMNEPLSIDDVDGALILAQEAVALDPDNVDIWRPTLQLAIFAEREELRTRALEQIGRLDPHDQSIRLMRLTTAIERFQTVEERIVAYEKTLADENIARIGPAVASRLALDFALLHRRQGNITEFSQRLGQAVTLDSSNRNAAAMAAGFFQVHVQDVYGQAELLTNLMLADPTDLTSQVALAQLLLEHGAYAGAERLYRLAVNGSLAAGNPPHNDLLADQAVALWAVGNHEQALETIRLRQAEMNEVYRNQVAAQARTENRNLTIIDLAKINAAVDPTLASVAAVIHFQRQDDQAQASLAAVLSAYQDRIEATKKSSAAPDPARLAQLHLEAAWVALWLGAELDRVSVLIAGAQEFEPLSQQAKDRFDGWLAYRAGELDKAVELLRPIPASDIAARLGLALALGQQGRTQDAAREFLAVNQAQPGSLIGIWAASRLATLLGQRVSLSDEAAKLEHLIASIPTQFDKYPQDASMALGLRVICPQLTVGPYEPIIFEIEITNNSMFPLALDRDGPIRPQVFIEPTIRSTGAPDVGAVRAIILDIGRQLRLLPREKLIVPVNLRNYHPTQVLNDEAVAGAIVKVTAIINFAVDRLGVVKPNLYGSEVESPLVRIDGQRVTNEWISQMMIDLQQPTQPGVLEQMALLSHVIAPAVPAGTSGESYKVIDGARTTFAEAYAKLSSDQQAWLLSVMPSGEIRAIEGLIPTLLMARKSENRLVRLTYLMFHSLGAQDPMLDAAIRGDDPALRRVAEIIRADELRAAAAAVSK